jgi:hypothetical protein
MLWQKIDDAEQVGLGVEVEKFVQARFRPALQR